VDSLAFFTKISNIFSNNALKTSLLGMTNLYTVIGGATLFLSATRRENKCRHSQKQKKLDFGRVSFNHGYKSNGKKAF